MMTRVVSMQDHIADDDLERFFLDLVGDQDECDRIRAHIMTCFLCTIKAEWTQDYVRKMREPLRSLHMAEE